MPMEMLWLFAGFFLGLAAAGLLLAFLTGIGQLVVGLLLEPLWTWK